MTDDTAKSHELYIENVERLEPNLSTIWGAVHASESSQATAQISIAISLKRIADALACDPTPAETGVAVALIAERLGTGSNFGLQIVDHLARHGFKIVQKR